MYTVSNEYKNLINNPMRRPQYIRIKIYNENFNNARQEFEPDDDALLKIDTSAPDSDIIFADSNWENEIEPMGTKLPVENFSFSFFDRNKIYNPEITGGTWEDMENMRPVSWWYGYQIGAATNTIEWIKGSTYLTTGQNDWDKNGGLPKVTINASSIIAYLENEAATNTQATYYDIVDNSLKNSMLAVVQNGWFSWVIDESLKNYSSTFLANKAFPVNQTLQLVAQAGGCILKTDRNGNISISKYVDVMSEYWRMGYDKVLTTPAITKYPMLLSLSTSYVSIVAEDNFTNVTGDGYYWFPTKIFDDYYAEYGKYDWVWTTLSFDVGYGEFKVDEAVYVWDEGSSIRTLATSRYAIRQISEYAFELGVNPMIYGIGYYAVPHGFKISGRKLIEAPYPTTTTYNVNDVGDVADFENPLLTSFEDASRTMKHMEQFLMMRNMYSDLGNRGYPEVDCGDIIYAQSDYNYQFPVIVLSNNISFNGALSGTMKYLAKNIGVDTQYGLLVDDTRFLLTGDNKMLDWRGI